MMPHSDELDCAPRWIRTTRRLWRGDRGALCAVVAVGASAVAYAGWLGYVHRIDALELVYGLPIAAIAGIAGLVLARRLVVRLPSRLPRARATIPGARPRWAVVAAAGLAVALLGAGGYAIAVREPSRNITAACNWLPPGSERFAERRPSSDPLLGRSPASLAPLLGMVGNAPGQRSGCFESGRAIAGELSGDAMLLQVGCGAPGVRITARCDVLLSRLERAWQVYPAPSETWITRTVSGPLQVSIVADQPTRGTCGLTITKAPGKPRDPMRIVDWSAIAAR